MSPPNSVNTTPPGWGDYGLLLLLAGLWGGSFLLIKVAVATVPPFTLVAIRLSLGALLLVAVAAGYGERLPREFAAWRVFAFVGLFGNALPFVLISVGEQTIDSGLAAILMGVMPVATVALAHAFIPDEPFHPMRGLGVAIGFTGMVILVGWQALGHFSAAVVAQLVVLAGAVSYAVNTVYARLRARHSGRIMAAGATVMGALYAIPMALWLERPLSLAPTPASLIAVILLGIFPTALATLVYFTLLSRIGATSLSQINYLIPVFGFAWGVLLLGEQPTWRAGAALLVVLVGITLVNYRPRARTVSRPGS